MLQFLIDRIWFMWHWHFSWRATRQYAEICKKARRGA